MYISIHVPTWGTTAGFFADHQSIIISIHVPTWGTTSLGRRIFRTMQFQFTFPRGERHSYALTPAQAIDISIHVPTWGTTKFCTPDWKLVKDFNSRSHVGNDRW